MTDKIEVTAADRDAAWPYRPSCYKVDDYSNWMAGKYDLAATVIKGFARHRLASTADAQPVAVQGLVEALEWFLTGDIDVSGQALIYDGHWEDIAAKIRKARKALTTYQEQCDAE